MWKFERWRAWIGKNRTIYHFSLNPCLFTSSSCSLSYVESQFSTLSLSLFFFIRCLWTRNSAVWLFFSFVVVLCVIYWLSPKSSFVLCLFSTIGIKNFLRGVHFVCPVWLVPKRTERISDLPFSMTFVLNLLTCWFVCGSNEFSSPRIFSFPLFCFYPVFLLFLIFLPSMLSISLSWSLCANRMIQIPRLMFCWLHTTSSWLNPISYPDFVGDASSLVGQ